MFNKTPFYFSLIRKYVILFGTLFNNIYISRTDKNGNTVDMFKVPIMYGPKETALTRVLQDANIDRPTATATLPIMAFHMTGFAYDGNRKLQTVNKLVSIDTDDPNVKKYQWVSVPYTLGFNLYILVKNAEDGTKIVEQILPYFTPDWTVSAILIPEMNVIHDIPVVLKSINLEDDHAYNTDFRKRRTIIWTLSFDLKGYFYGPVKTSKIIKYTNTQFFFTQGEFDTSGKLKPVSYVTIRPGLTANGQPTSNASLSISAELINANDDYGFIIEQTDL